MYMPAIAAFAFILWLPDDLPMEPFVTSARWTIGLVMLQQMGILLASVGLSRWTIARLEQDPPDSHGAQHLFARGGAICRTALVLSFVGICLFTKWIGVLEGVSAIRWVFGGVKLAVLMPFLTGAVLMWVGLHSGDQAIRQLALATRLGQGGPVRPVWGMGEYLIFQLRHQLLIIAAPMALIVMSYDAIDVYSDKYLVPHRLFWVRELMFGVVAGVVFLLAPLAMRWIWSTASMPPGDLRDRLVRITERVGLKYRDILIWKSEGILVNAAVMGLFAPLRFVMLSDGLLESMDDEKIEAVFGHEVGHVKLRHMEFFLIFAIASMFVVGGVLWALHIWVRLDQWIMDTIAFGLVVLLWGGGFGWISRRFERQADLFGARCLSPQMVKCRQACAVHQPVGSVGAVPVEHPVCSTAAGVFADALYRVAYLNGIPADEPSWRHSSIASRANFLRTLASDENALASFETTLRYTRLLLVVAFLFGLAGAVVFYWPLW
jgi:STE24 endopeptidase